MAAELKQCFSVSLNASWISRCLSALRSAHADAHAWPRQRLLEAVLGQALCADLREAGAPSLPQDVQVRQSGQPQQHQQ